MEQKEVEDLDLEHSRCKWEDLLDMYMMVSATNHLGDDDTKEADEICELADEIIKLAGKIIKLSGRLGKKFPENKTMDTIIEYLGKRAKEKDDSYNLQTRKKVLPTHLYLDELEGYKQSAYRKGIWKARQEGWDLSVYIGLYNDPVNQVQIPLVRDLAVNGHLAVCGAPFSGKSTFLQTFVYSMICKYTPDVVNIYGIDYSNRMLSAFEQAPHVGGLVYEGEEEKVDKLLKMLSGIIHERKVLFQRSNYSQYVQIKGITLPAIVLVIDNFDDFRKKAMDFEQGDINHNFRQIVETGISCGVFVVIAGSISSLTSSIIRENFRTDISLELYDKSQYEMAVVGRKIDTIPQAKVKGRGLVQVGERFLEYQTALALCADNDFKRSEIIADLAEEMNKIWSGKRPKKIPEIPKKLFWSEFVSTEEVQKMLEDDRSLPVGYDVNTASVYGVDLFTNYCYLISGDIGKGKTNMLKVLIQSAALKGGKLVVIDFSKELKEMCEGMDVTYVADDIVLYNYLKDSLIEDFKARNVKKKKKITENMSDDEIFVSMNQEKKIYIFLTDLAEFIRHIYTPDNGVGAMNAAIENLWDKGCLHNIYWFGCLEKKDIKSVQDMMAYKLFIKEMKGVHFGGNALEQKIFNFDYLKYREQCTPEKTGIAMLPESEEGGTVRKVVIPLCK